MKNKFKTLSKYSFVISLVIFVVSYFTFHFVTDAGITFVWHPECGKPFVTAMIAGLGVLFLFSSFMSLLIVHVFFKEESGK